MNFIIRSNIDSLSHVGYSVLVILSTRLSGSLLWILAESKEEALGAHITHKKARAVLIAVLLFLNIVVAGLPRLNLNVGSVGTGMVILATLASLSTQAAHRKRVFDEAACL